MRTIRFIAKTCHELNKTLCEQLGDKSQPHWEDAPEWQKNSAIDGVHAILDGRVKRPEDSHANWMAEKERAGWSFGPAKDLEAKRHPCMVPFGELPFEQQLKDHLFFWTVVMLLGDENV